MHSFFTKVLSSLALLVIAFATTALSAATDNPRTLVGYSSKQTVRPGDTLDFMVNAIEGGMYSADLVRIVNGDYLSRYKEHFEVVTVDAPFAGDYTGVAQALNPGSYVEVQASRKLDGLKSFTVAAWIYPTFDPTEYVEPDLSNPDPFYPPTLNIGKNIGSRPLFPASTPQAVPAGHCTLTRLSSWSLS